MPKARLRASLVLCNVPTTNSEAAQKFYGLLLGTDFARAPNEDVESYFAPISEDGIDITITQRYVDEERLTVYFAVDDLAQTLAELQDAGGEVVVAPQPVTISERASNIYRETARLEGYDVGGAVGTMAVVLDPDRNHVGLMQLDESAQSHFRVGNHQRALGRDQIIEFAQAKEAGKEI